MNLFTPLNDISTDLEDPPPILERRLPSARTRGLVSRLYPDLAPLQIKLAPDVVYRRCLERAREMSGWTMGAHDPAAMLFSGTAATSLLKFTDDFTVRVSAQDGHTRVDMRSRSRIGLSDLGANNRRIREFFKVLGAEFGAAVLS